ncbi:MAG: cytochrome b/b6 domain-containing protein [Chloroflexota bacterium]
MAQVQGKVTHKDEADYIVRFSAGQRIEHIVLMVTFIALAVTGLAQKFYTTGWAEWVILNLGGIEYTRLVHRAFGLLFTLSMVYHLGYLVYALFIRHSKPSMLPSLKDVRDVINVLRYSFGFAEKPPQFGRYDYRQKFEYWGILFGGTVMTITGFILVYPLSIAAFLPGELVAASQEAHGNEAMLAVLVIVIWHLYDVIFKPKIFPVDTSIHTGRISRERMMAEHPLEYAELMGSGDEVFPVASAEEPRQETA